MLVTEQLLDFPSGVFLSPHVPPDLLRFQPIAGC
jgi:hypothetical protein